MVNQPLNKLWTGVSEMSRSGKEYETKKLLEIPPLLFVGLIESHCRPVRDGDYKSISIDLAARTLLLPKFLDQLPQITLWTSVPRPYLPYLPQMAISLSAPGYDARTGIYTLLDAPEIDETLSVEEAAKAWRSLLAEFCFSDDPSERERCISVALAAALTPFCIYLLPEKAKRPGFAVSANAEGARKTLLLSFGMVALLGFVPTGAAPKDENEMRKILDAAAEAGASILFLDNLKGHLNSGELEAFITSTVRRFRRLGTTNHSEAENLATVYLTAHFATFSPDLRRRLLVIELFLKEAKAEERIIEHYLNEEQLIALRERLLSIFWAIAKNWDQKGQPGGSICLPSFEEWSRVVGGMLENAGFVSPCSQAYLKTGGDTFTRDMELLVREMVPGTEYKFSDLADLAKDHHLFASLIPETGNMEPKNITRLGKLFRRYLDRTFDHHLQFRLQPGTRYTERYYVTDLNNPF
jgi:hypothetical protein